MSSRKKYKGPSRYNPKIIGSLRLQYILDPRERNNSICITIMDNGMFIIAGALFHDMVQIAREASRIIVEEHIQQKKERESDFLTKPST